MELPVGTYGRLTSRSSTMVKGMNVGPGVVDRDFRGEIKVLVMNGSDQPYVINPGDRVAQMVIEKVYEGELKTVKDVGESHRGSGGFGSTGVRSLRLTGGGGSSCARGERGRSQEPPTTGVRLRSRERSRTRTFPREASPEEVNVTYHDDGSASTQRVTGEKVYFRAPAMHTTSVRRPPVTTSQEMVEVEVEEEQELSGGAANYFWFGSGAMARRVEGAQVFHVRRDCSAIRHSKMVLVGDPEVVGLLGPK